MSTRSVIAKVRGDGFEGRYAHCDGYPTARGKELFESYRELGSAEALIKYALREGESGYWSSYCPPSELVEADRSTPEGEAAFQNSYQTGIRYNWAHEADNFDLIQSDGDDWGAEWAYVIADKGLTVFEALDGWKYIGTYAWDAEPNWEAVENTNNGEDES